jgi:hypothetical protein
MRHASLKEQGQRDVLLDRRRPGWDFCIEAVRRGMLDKGIMYNMMMTWTGGSVSIWLCVQICSPKREKTGTVSWIVFQRESKFQTDKHEPASKVKFDHVISLRNLD